MPQEESLPPMSPKRLAIIGGVLGGIILIFIIVLAAGGGKPSTDSAKGKLETATVTSIQAQINLNYVTEGEYAYSYDNLIEEAEDKDKELLREYRDILKDFDYSVRGDDKAYQITYTNVAGDTITVQGNYSQEYH